MGKLDFTKMHGCGNDYVYIDCYKQDVEAPELLARTLSDRHKGVGGDGVILICPSETADAKMRMFNADEKWRDADYLLDYSGEFYRNFRVDFTRTDSGWGWPE